MDADMATGAPTSWVIRLAKSPVLSSMTSQSLSSSSRRSSSGVCDHAGSARDAARTASSTSCPVALEMTPSTCSVLGIHDLEQATTARRPPLTPIQWCLAWSRSPMSSIRVIRFCSRPEARQCQFGSVSSVAPTVACRRRRNVQSRVAVEETPGAQPEAAVFDRHYRPVLRPGDMREPESVPED